MTTETSTRPKSDISYLHTPEAQKKSREGVAKFYKAQSEVFAKQYAAMVAAGKTDAEIAEWYGCSRDRFKTRLRRHGITPQPTVRPMSRVDHLHTPENKAKRKEAMERTNTERKDSFLAEYEHFVSYGMSDEDIAKRFGCRLSSMHARLRRYGYQTEWTVEQERCYQAIDRLIASGVPFTINDTDSGLDRPILRSRLASLRKQGKIVAAGKRRNAEGHTVTLWIVAEEAASA